MPVFGKTDVLEMKIGPTGSVFMILHGCVHVQKTPRTGVKYGIYGITLLSL